ncbi:MAG: ABC transporter ATP-binding protein [Acidobacteria bacterium]|nr:MAG: ABC transporter ATP-binding protein [Acidobacteriota bacterium]
MPANSGYTGNRPATLRASLASRSSPMLSAYCAVRDLSSSVPRPERETLMLRHTLTFENVTFAYEQMTFPLLSGVSFAFPLGWTGVVGANGAGKTTILRHAAGLLRPDSGWIRRPGGSIYCEQRTDEPPACLNSFLDAADGVAIRLRGSLGIHPDSLTNWAVLSHGERKRAQIAVALWQEPGVLALDEPTNHIDQGARRLLLQALDKYRGIGLIVSHDRNLLDSLCRQCLFVDLGRMVMRPGGYTAGRAQADREEASAFEQRELLKDRCLRLKKQVGRARSDSGRSSRKGTKRGLSSRDHDARAKVDIGRVTGRDAAVVRRAVQLQKRLERESKLRDSVAVKKQYALGVWTEGAESRRDTLFRLRAGFVSLGGTRRLVYPDLMMAPSDRIALTGPNGSGKSSLVGVILRQLNVPPERLVYLPQEIDAISSARTIEQVRHFSSDQLGLIMSLVTRLGSDAVRVMETIEPSPGEIRKVLIAIGLAASPHLIILDEPTNHLDLPSIECLEKALMDCSCGLLLASHDERFLAALTHRQWRTAPSPHDPDCILLGVS